MIKLQAHRGVSTENPENTMPAFAAAIDQGYNAIELDVAVTKDLVCILLHDATVNRTARHPDGSIIEDPVDIATIAYEQACRYDYGIAFHPKFAGTKPPLLKDVLDMARKAGVQLKIDAKYTRLLPEHKAALFDLIRPWQDVAAITCKEVADIAEAHREFPDMQLHYGGLITEEILEALSAIVPKEQLTLWLPYPNARTSYVTVPFVSPERAAMCKRYGSLGIWNLDRYSQMEEMEALGADIVETNGQIKPYQNPGVLSDNHTHSRNSHDANYPVMDICRAEIDAGVKVMAVADHCDIFLCEDDPERDAYTNIRESVEEAVLVNEQVGDDCLVLKSVELGEGFWHPEVCKKVLSLADYDVVVGAIHAVKCAAVEGCTGMKRAYSQIDYLNLPLGQLYELMDKYFDDVLTMVQTVDIDIMAHLTCPTGYPLSRCGIKVEVRQFEEKIRKILQCIIDKGIAMEINGTRLAKSNVLTPHRWIVEMYRDMGGYLVCLASDAHSPKGAAAGFPEAVAMLKEMGFRDIFYYKDRKAVPCALL